MREARRLEAKDEAEASGDVPSHRCWVEGCERQVFLDFAHRRSFRSGGGQNYANIFRLCHEHHGQFDGGGWRLFPRRDGVVVMIDRRGVVVGRLRTPSTSPPALGPP